MRLLSILSLFSLFSSIQGDAIDDLKKWTNNIKLQVKSNDHFYNTFQKWIMINDDYVYTDKQKSKLNKVKDDVDLSIMLTIMN